MMLQLTVQHAISNLREAGYAFSARNLSDALAEIKQLDERLATAEAEVKRLRGDGQFVVHTGDDLEYYESEQAAIDAARRAIDDWSDMCDPGWPDGVERVWVARIVHEVERIETESEGVEYWDYRIAERVTGDLES